MTLLQETGNATYKVSARGQLSLPADARRRWGLERGGEVEVFDLGGCLVMLPTSAGSIRAELSKALTADRSRSYVEAILRASHALQSAVLGHLERAEPTGS